MVMGARLNAWLSRMGYWERLAFFAVMCGVWLIGFLLIVHLYFASLDARDASEVELKRALEPITDTVLADMKLQSFSNHGLNEEQFSTSRLAQPYAIVDVGKSVCDVVWPGSLPFLDVNAIHKIGTLLIVVHKMVEEREYVVKRGGLGRYTDAGYFLAKRYVSIIGVYDMKNAKVIGYAQIEDPPLAENYAGFDIPVEGSCNKISAWARKIFASSAAH